jgi:hypothetical protein
MNRGILGLGVFLLIVATALMVSPIVLTGTESLTLFAEVGVFLIPVGVVVSFVGGEAIDPSITTIGGVFGNPVENELRQRLRQSEPTLAHRSRTSPRESVNCRKCYTMIAWDLIDCPRCGRPRECRGCERSLSGSDGRILCDSCHRDEIYCNCPGGQRAAAAFVPAHRRAL